MNSSWVYCHQYLLLFEVEEVDASASTGQTHRVAVYIDINFKCMSGKSMKDLSSIQLLSCLGVSKYSNPHEHCS